MVFFRNHYKSALIIPLRVYVQSYSLLLALLGIVQMAVLKGNILTSAAQTLFPAALVKSHNGMCLRRKEFL
jgi:hypothetical protein